LDKDYDVFVHHTQIRKENKADYKSLVMGEYVQFEIIENTNTTSCDKHKYVASDVCGVGGGPLMCDTRRKYRDSRKGDEDADLPDLVEAEDEGEFIPVVSRRRDPEPISAPVLSKRKYVRRTVA
jgi:cold shock CspA family protein